MPDKTPGTSEASPCNSFGVCDDRARMCVYERLGGAVGETRTRAARNKKERDEKNRLLIKRVLFLLSLLHYIIYHYRCYYDSAGTVRNIIYEYNV